MLWRRLYEIEMAVRKWVRVKLAGTKGRMLWGLIFLRLSSRLLIWLPTLHLFLNTAVTMENPLAGRISITHTCTPTRTSNLSLYPLHIYILICYITEPVFWLLTPGPAPSCRLISSRPLPLPHPLSIHINLLLTAGVTNLSCCIQWFKTNQQSKAGSHYSAAVQTLARSSVWSAFALWQVSQGEWKLFNKLTKKKLPLFSSWCTCGKLIFVCSFFHSLTKSESFTIATLNQLLTLSPSHFFHAGFCPCFSMWRPMRCVWTDNEI